MRTTIVWVIGLVTAVPYAVYHLLFHATRDQYAFLITFVLFWVFGFWGVVAPALSALKIHQLLRALEKAGSGEELKRNLQSAETKEVAIDLIAEETRLPRFVARRLYGWVERRLRAG